MSGKPRVLAWARTPDGVAVGLSGRLTWTTPDGWGFVRWDEIEHGRWDRVSSTLHWTLPEGAKGELVLSEPGRLPELFAERVAASIVVVRQVDFGSRRRAIISARRNLEADGLLEWRAVRTPGWPEDDPEADALLQAELARIRAEYDIA
ncbi:MAG: hypothetical protein IPL43_02395 [Micropruina sp.]|nr:hypothetical protein [Micropruina sp.]